MACERARARRNATVGNERRAPEQLWRLTRNRAVAPELTRRRDQLRSEGGADGQVAQHGVREREHTQADPHSRWARVHGPRSSPPPANATVPHASTGSVTSNNRLLLSAATT